MKQSSHYPWLPIQPPPSLLSSDTNALSETTQQEFPKTPAKAPISKSKHKYPDDDGTIQEGVRRMGMETDALRRATHN
jgi:hypothetical protein